MKMTNSCTSFDHHFRAVFILPPAHFTYELQSCQFMINLGMDHFSFQALRCELQQIWNPYDEKQKNFIDRLVEADTVDWRSRIWNAQNKVWKSLQMLKKIKFENRFEAFNSYQFIQFVVGDTFPRPGRRGKSTAVRPARAATYLRQRVCSARIRRRLVTSEKEKKKREEKERLWETNKMERIKREKKNRIERIIRE